MKKVKALALLMAVILAVPTTPVTAVKAADSNDNNSEPVIVAEQLQPEIPDTSGYNLVWHDEFEGESLNRDDWNVELWEKGHFNDELQEYVDSDDTLKVSGGTLKINATKTDAAAGAESMIPSNSSINGTYDATGVVSDDWKVQAIHTGLSIEAGKAYYISFKAKTDGSGRTIPVCLQQNGGAYKTYGALYQWITNEEQTYSFVTTVDTTDASARLAISMGRTEATKDSTAAGNITISDFEMYEVTPVTVSGVENVEKTHEITEVGDTEYAVQSVMTTSLSAGRTYRVSFKAQSTVERKIVVNVQQNYGEYNGYANTKVTVPKDYEGTFYMDFTMPSNEDNAAIAFNMGNVDGASPSTVTIKDVQFTDITIQKATPERYTSARINTQNKKTFTYGVYEVRAKVPTGKGYLPAFWLMSNDENIYGQWPRCGEIDCMEVLGEDTKKAYGTIHYGNPHKENQGTKITAAGDPTYAEEFHTFTTEWNPGEIIWYVDGVEYYRTSDWYSTTEGKGTLTYPAPFDQPFYMILNLAVGGTWPGDPNSTTSFENNPFEIDYVRVYQKDSYDENVKAPEKAPVIYREPDDNGNYIINGTFVSEDLDDNAAWEFLLSSEKGGAGSATIDNNEIKIVTTAQGTEDYAVQLVQAGIPFKKGATYKLTFKAKADEVRNMGVDIKAPDLSYISYMPSETAALTTEYQTFEYNFKMNSASDPNGRLEYNMGAKGSTANIYIKDVILEMTGAPDEPEDDNKKGLLSDGNYIYNGEFGEGDGHIGCWTIEGTDNYSVTGFADGRRLKAILAEDENLIISQDELAFENGLKYVFSVNVESDKDTSMVVKIGDLEYSIPVSAGKSDYTVKIPGNEDISGKNFTLTVNGGVTVYIDNIRLAEDVLLMNGAVSYGAVGYETYIENPANADISFENGEISAVVTNDGAYDYQIQIKQNNVPLYNGHNYTLKFKVKSTVDRKVRVIMQGDKAHNWDVYSGATEKFNATSEYQEYTVNFTMNKDTDLGAFLSICLGKVDESVAEEHTVAIDNISLVDNDVAEDEEVSCNVTFDSNGGKIGTAETVSANKVSGSKVGTLPVATREGYDFLGWFTAKTGGTKISADTRVVADTTFYAQWKEKTVTPQDKYYTVKFDANGGKIGSDAVKTESRKEGSKLGELPVASRESYDFLGWFTAKTEGVKITAETVVSGDITYYAQWKEKAVDPADDPTDDPVDDPVEKTYTVTFDANGGTVDKKSITVKNGEKYGELPVPSHKSQVFLGWYTSLEEGTEITADTIVKLDKDQTLYAMWDDITLVVKQKYDVSKCFEGIEGIDGYKVEKLGGKAKIKKNGILTASKSGLISVVPCKKTGKKLTAIEGVNPVYFNIISPKFNVKPVLTYVGETVSANDLLTVVPGAGNTVTWMVSKDNAAVSGNQIVALKSGKTKLTAVFTNDQGQTVKISTLLTVKIPKLSVKETLTLKLNKTKKVSVKNTVKNAFIDWTSSNEEVVTVTGKGKSAKLKAVGSGTATITCEVDGHPYKAVVTVP